MDKLETEARSMKMKIDALNCDDKSNLSALIHDMSVSCLTSRVWTVISHSSTFLQGINPTEQDEDIDKISMIVEGSDGDETAGGQVQIRRSASFLSDSLKKIQGINPAGQNEDIDKTAMIIKGSDMLTGFSFKPIVRSSDGIINFLNDDKSQMTYGRIFALSLINKPWYNPSLNLAENDINNEDSKCMHGDNPSLELAENDNEISKEPAPSLEKAWAYFEHITLPRHLYKPQDGNHPKELENAKAGEDQHETRLYSPLFTHSNQMGDFGLGMGLYFDSLKFLIIITFIAGLICIPNIIYYNSESYSKGQAGLKLMLSGSAVCTDISWVPCPTCKFTQYHQSLIHASDSGLIFVRKNNCNAPPFMEGMLNLAVAVLMVVALWIMNKQQNRMAVKLDLDEQTAQDYSIHITNPPPDANDPKEWKRFFEDQFPGAHVTCCTICVNNDYLLKALVELRERYNQIKRKLPPGTKLDDKSLSLLAATCENNRSGLSYILQFLHPFGHCLDIAALYNKVVVLTSEIKRLSQLNNPVTSVFVTFETEMFQRQVLSSLSVSKYDALINNTKIMKDKKQLFRGKHVLQIVEAEEPSGIRWLYFNAPFIKSLKAVCISTVLTISAVVFFAWIIRRTHDTKGYMYTSLLISFLNVVFPEISKRVTEIELHKLETGYQTSLFVKIAFFRFVNTAIVINIITPFDQTLGGDANNSLIPMVYSIFFADVVTTNLYVFFEPFGHVKRHILGPRQTNQDFMNKQFKGSKITLAERYTNMTKIVFHGFYYCTLFPAAFFMSSAALFINYYVDKFSVMRTWVKTPKTGISISRINVLFIFPISVLAMTLLSSYWWSGFPYDNLCESGVIENKYVGDHFFDTNNNVNSELYVVDNNSTSYQYCNQNLLTADGVQFTFPAIPYWQNTDKWTTKDQELVREIFRWASVCVLGILSLHFAWFVKKYIVSLFQATYEPRGEDQNINFSSNQDISCYIPQFVSKEFSYPLIASCVDGVDTGLFEWKDPDKPHEFYNIIQDAKEIAFGADDNKELPTNAFSRVYHYPPNIES